MKNSFFSGAIVDEWKQLASKHCLSWSDSFIKWELPFSVAADFAVVIALQLARKLGKSPYQLALELSKDLPSAYSFEVTVTKDGYLNCHVKDHFYKLYLKTANNQQLVTTYQRDFFRVNIEFVSVNPTGYLHLGHLRNAIIGDTLAKVYTFLGYQVTREYYINDKGNQIDELVKSVLFYYNQLGNDKSCFPEETLSYQGLATRNAALWLRESSTTSVHSHNERSIYTREKIIDFFIEKIKLDLSLCGVEFDNWFSEKKLFSDREKLNSLIKVFEERNLVYYEKKTLFLHTNSNSDNKDRVLIKGNGEFTYFFSDILYHLDKMERADLLINVWGSDHHGYVERLRSALQMLGYNQQERLVIILLQMVTLLKNGENKKLSKRAGTVIEIEEALSIIGKDQLRFCLLEKEVGHSISINLSLLKEQEEKSRLYYLQYAHARCHQLVLRAKKFGLYSSDPFVENIFLLKASKERGILKDLIRFESIVYAVIAEKKPSIITQYLQVLAREFQVYYQSHQIVDNSNHKLTGQRIFLVNAVKEVLKKGLSLCGVEAPTLMKNVES